MLGLPGEQALALSPLPPEDSAALFVRRAEAAGATPRRTADDDAAIAKLVQLLDGLPLAIELAAARVRLMPARTVLARMSERFALLSSLGGRRDRHATLRATFDWSWDLLSTSDKAALAHLSVFEGGFTLEAAEAVLDLSAIDGGTWTVDAVHSLVDKSFVRPVSDARFDLLVSVQEYTAEHLRNEGRFPGSGPVALQAAYERHGAYFASLGKERAVDDACADLDNLVAACRRSLSIGHGKQAIGALEGAWAVPRPRGPFEARLLLAASVCEMPGLGDRSAARAQVVRANACTACGNPQQAHVAYGKALALARAEGDRLLVAKVLSGLGWTHLHQGQSGEARQHYLDAIQAARKLGERPLECAATSGLAAAELLQGQTSQALSGYERALALARETGDRHTQGTLLTNLGNLLAEIGDMDAARALDEEVLAITRETCDRATEGNTLCNLGLLHLTLGRLDEAVAVSEAALVLARELGHVRLECITQCNLGIAFEKLCRPDEAQRHFEAALGIARQLGDLRIEGQFLGYLGLLHARQGRPEDAPPMPRHRGDAVARGVRLPRVGRAAVQPRRGPTPGG